MKTRDLPPGRAAVYLQKARRFRAAAEACLAQGQWDPAVSAAVHAGINAVDAACVRSLGRRSSGPQHEEAGGLLARIESIPAGQRNRLVRHSEILVAMKHRAEYEDRLCDEADAKRAVGEMRKLLGGIEALFEA